MPGLSVQAHALRPVQVTAAVPSAREVPGLKESGLIIEGGVLCRPQENANHPLGCTIEGGPGAIIALDRLPGGTTFVAAERGIFTLSPEVEHLDLLKLIDGAPQGPLVGIATYGSDRLWIATENSLGCIDTRQGFGRTLGPEDGLPVGPYAGLGLNEAGELLLEAPSGLFEYRPGRTPPPTLTALTINGTAHVRGKQIELQHKSPLLLQAEGTASGGASFRYRLQRHHLWRPLADSAHALADLEPGKHTLLVSAWDRELRRSTPQSVQVLVHYPAMLATDRLPLLLLGVGALLLLGFLVQARRIGGGFPRYKRALLSCCLLIIVSFQALVGLVFPHGRSWPFVGFTMYTESCKENQVVYNQKLYIRRADGMLRELPQLRRVYDGLQLHQALIPVAQGGEKEKERFLQLLNQNLEADYIGFLVLDHRIRLTSAGPIPISPTVQCAYPPELFDDR